jgi:hypothetical protein
VNNKGKPLVEAEKSSAQAQRKPRNLANPTKREITGRPSERIDIEVFDFWLEGLDVSTLDSFYSFAKDTFSPIQVYMYARFLGYRGSIVASITWVNNKFPKPNHLKILLSEIKEMQEDIRKLREDIENFVVKRDVGVARIASLQKELRSTISQVDSFISSRDNKGLLMAGADRAIRELMLIFKDDPIESPLHEASLSVWAKMQYED